MTVTWEEAGQIVRAEGWQALLLPDAPAGQLPFDVWAIHDPAYPQPWLLVTPLPIPARAVRDLYRDRWPVEQVPLAAKQMLGAGRQFVHAPETCQRWPELSLLAGTILSYVAATLPAVPTGLDRKSTRLNSSHDQISYAVFCLKKKNKRIGNRHPKIINYVIFTGQTARFSRIAVMNRSLSLLENRLLQIYSSIMQLMLTVVEMW